MMILGNFLCVMKSRPVYNLEIRLLFQMVGPSITIKFI